MQHTSLDTHPSILALTLNPNNPANTTFLDENGNRIYSICTTFDTKDVPTTAVYDETGKRVADWRWKEPRLDAQMLRFERAGVGKAQERACASKWLRKNIVPFKTTVLFRNLQGREFKWKNNDPGLYLQLVSTSNTSIPIARFVPPTRARVGPSLSNNRNRSNSGTDSKFHEDSSSVYYSSSPSSCDPNDAGCTTGCGIVLPQLLKYSPSDPATPTPPTSDRIAPAKPLPFTTPAKLLLNEGAEEIMDEVIVSWALLEIAKRRKEEDDAKRIGSGMIC